MINLPSSWIVFSRITTQSIVECMINGEALIYDSRKHFMDYVVVKNT